MFALFLVVAGGCWAAQGAQEAQGTREAQTVQAAQPGLTLDQLMKLFAQRRHGTVPYVEEDDLAILDRPVKSSGVLVYDAPDHLEKRTLKPKPQSLILDGDQLTVQRGHRTYRMQLSSYPQVAPFVDAVRETLAGNEEGLRKVFEVGLAGSLQDWRLQLVPLDKAVARKVARVEIAGVRADIRSVAILQVDGDQSLMTLGPPTAATGASP